MEAEELLVGSDVDEVGRSHGGGARNRRRFGGARRRVQVDDALAVGRRRATRNAVRAPHLNWASPKNKQTMNPKKLRLKPQVLSKTMKWKKKISFVKELRAHGTSSRFCSVKHGTKKTNVWNNSTVEFDYIIHRADRTKVADISGWMIKPVRPNSSSKCQLYCEKKNQSDDVELLCCTALACAMFHELELVQDHNFFFPCQTCPFRWSHLARMKHNHLCWQTGVAVAARESVSQATTPAIRAICAALSAQMLPLAPLKVADITGGLDDISGGFLM